MAPISVLTSLTLPSCVHYKHFANSTKIKTSTTGCNIQK